VDIYGKGWAGQKFNASFADDGAIANSYQWDTLFSDSDLFKSGVGGRGSTFPRPMIWSWSGSAAAMVTTRKKPWRGRLLNS